MNYRKARFQHDCYEGYWVTLYLIFDGERIYTFYTQDDWIDNCALMVENGTHVHQFAHEVLCTPTHLPELYQKVRELCV